MREREGDVAFRSNRNQASFRRGPKRAVEWSICSAPTGFSAVASDAKIVLVQVPQTALADVGPGTVVRVRGVFSIKPTTEGSSANIVGAFGMGFVNTVAGALGTTAVPGPQQDCDWGGWLVHQFFNQRWNVGTDVGRAWSTIEYPIDSKAMRKFEAGMDMVWVVESGGGSSFDAAVSARLLVKAG